VPADPSFVEVAARVWVLRHPSYDLNLTCVGGERGLLLVDTHASDALAREVLDAARALGAGPVVAVVNTHDHFDHVLGNATVRDDFPAVPIHAHEECAAGVARLDADRVVVPDHTLSSAAAVDLGDRAVELVHPGRGHTAGDLVVRVPDADVVLAGDLVEESAPPAYGDDSFPLDWPHSLDLLLQLVGPDTVVVPGHGAVVGHDFVLAQRSDIGVVAGTIRDLASRGVPLRQALEAAEWPFPREALVDAVRRGYAQLPRGGRQLPLA
jgi:glyoxylase-like metal-dependent hydrolase (beta-lactamase superfamily II)